MLDLAYSSIVITLLSLSLSQPVNAQSDADTCALNCIANVNGTTCAQSQWPCLCASEMYIRRLNDCTRNSCNKTDQDSTFAAIAEICNVFSVPVTNSEEAMAATSTDSPLLSTLDVSAASSTPAGSTYGVLPPGSNLSSAAITTLTGTAMATTMQATQTDGSTASGTRLLTPSLTTGTASATSSSPPPPSAAATTSSSAGSTTAIDSPSFAVRLGCVAFLFVARSYGAI